MTLHIDHLVILVHDLEAAMADYTALGFTVQRGGTHADGATHNALVGFADGSYLELIAFLKPSPEHRWGAAAAQGGEGFIDFALLPSSVGAVVQAAAERGLVYQGPLDGGRTRPDGAVLRWQTGTPSSPDLPFLCGDVTPRALRVPEGAVRVHANGALGVASLTVAVADLEVSMARYQALLGLGSGRGGAALTVAGLGLRQALLPLGSATLVLVAAGPDRESPAALALHKLLGSRQQGVVGLSLLGKAHHALPLARTHGAAIDLQPA